MNVNITEPIASFLDRHNLGVAEYAKTFAIAIRGWRQLNWDILASVRTVKLNVNSDMTVTLPNDVINVVDVGVDNHNGGIASFTRTTNLNPYSDFEAINEEASNPFLGFNNDLRESENVLTQETSLGVGSYNTIGEYSLNLTQRKIYLQPNSGYNQLVVSYLTYSGHDDCEYYINEQATEALLSFIDWQFHLGDKRIGVQEKRDKERLFYNDKRKAKRRIKQLTTADLNQAVRISVKQGIKS